MTKHATFNGAKLPLLTNHMSYVRCEQNLATDAAAREYWLKLFKRHFPKLLEYAVEESVERGEHRALVEQRAHECKRQFLAYLDHLATANHLHQQAFDLLTICLMREEVLRNALFPDPYRLEKQRENEAAMALLPALVERLDALPANEQLPQVIRGVFAGNIYDLGATRTADRFSGGEQVDFEAILGELKDRPWLIDDYDALEARLLNDNPHRCCAMFVDNAGCDVVLGMIPFARFLLQRGTDVILTANITPTLNDITHDELERLIKKIAQWDKVIGDALAEDRLTLVNSGNTVPLIDLKNISQDLVDEIERKGADFVVLEGMGRAVESNLTADLKCDVVKVAMIKDKGVADSLGGELYDLVLRFDPAKPKKN